MANAFKAKGGQWMATRCRHAVVVASVVVASVVALTLATTLLPAAPAAASVVVVDGDLVAFGAEPGERNNMRVNWGNNPGARPSLTDSATIATIDEECEFVGYYVYCDTPGRPRFGLLLGDGDDYGASLNSQSRGTRTEIFGQAGDDVLYSYEGGDILDGGAGNDTLIPDGDHPYGGDIVIGGAGTDLLQLGGVVAPMVRASLDNKANDGTPGVRDNYRSSIENIRGTNHGRNRLVGNNKSNVLTGGDHADVIVGKRGRDRLNGLAGNDKLNARDGRRGDRVNCGSGRDLAIVDRGDKVRGCERVRRR